MKITEYLIKLDSHYLENCLKMFEITTMYYPYIITLLSVLLKYFTFDFISVCRFMHRLPLYEFRKVI